MADPIYDIAAISTNVSGDPATFYGTMSTTASTGAADTVSAQWAALIHTQMTSAGWTVVASSTANSR
ncbi:MAG: hypothetical protein MN733_43850, partial [Nitrososphaera sp.]|nr:hypothetical protein [Nitrososphaera sp.]